MQPITRSDSGGMAIVPGKNGLTLCPLRPYGRIEIEGEVCEGKAESGWIDESVAVVVVDSGSFGVVVREKEGGIGPSSESAGDSRRQQTSVGASTDNDQLSDRLYGPEFWLEHVNAILVVAVLWTAIGALLLVTGRPLSFDVLLLPVGGAISGAIFQYFIRGTRDLAGPYSDHRLQAYFFAAWMVGGAVIGVTAAFSLGGGFAAITGGLVLGTLCGASLALATHVM